MKNKKLVLGIIIGVLVGGVIGIKASELIQSSQVIYKDNKTVDVVLDSLFEELSLGKDKIAEAITNKGVDTTSNNTLDEMANNIDNISTGNPNLRYDEETGYIQVLNSDGEWTSIYQTPELPIQNWDGNAFPMTTASMALLGSWSSGTGVTQSATQIKVNSTETMSYFTTTSNYVSLSNFSKLTLVISSGTASCQFFFLISEDGDTVTLLSYGSAGTHTLSLSNVDKSKKYKLRYYVAGGAANSGIMTKCLFS